MSKLSLEIGMFQASKEKVHFCEFREPLTMLLTKEVDNKYFYGSGLSSCEFGLKLSIRKEFFDDDPNGLKNAEIWARRAIAEWVFGEFRPALSQLIELSRKVDFENGTKMQRIIEKLMDEMFR